MDAAGEERSLQLQRQPYPLPCLVDWTLGGAEFQGSPWGKLDDNSLILALVM